MICVQFSSKLLEQDSEPWVTHYADQLYNGKFAAEGWLRPDDFWEPPLWAAHVKAICPEATFRVVRDSFDLARVQSQAGPVVMSVFAANAKLVWGFVHSSPLNLRIHLGGSAADLLPFHRVPNVYCHESMQSFAATIGRRYVGIPDHSIYAAECAERCIPRLTLSTGCNHSCLFCTVEHPVKVVPRGTIIDDFDSMLRHYLKPKLVYVNDKTFGQAENWHLLRWLFIHGQRIHLGFKGFIIQTTATRAVNQLCHVDLSSFGIKYVELGIESFNDSILQKYQKPSSTRMIEGAMGALSDAGIPIIPNIMLGFLEETDESYSQTLDFLRTWSAHIHHVNLTHYADYSSPDARDRNENRSWRTWHDVREQQAWANNWSAHFYNWAIKHLTERR